MPCTLFYIPFCLYYRCYYFNILVYRQTRTCRNKLTDNNIFFKTDERILLALDGSIRKNSGCLLEGCGRQEGVCSKSCLGNTKKNIFKLRFRLAFAFCFAAYLLELCSVYE